MRFPRTNRRRQPRRLILAVTSLATLLLPSPSVPAAPTSRFESQAWEFRGVSPGTTTQSDLLGHAEWGQPLDRSDTPDGLVVLKYKVARSDVQVTLRKELVVAIDIHMPDGVALEKVVQVFHIGEPLPTAPLPAEALVGPAVPKELRGQRYKPDGVVIYMSDDASGPPVKRVRFFAPAPAVAAPPPVTESATRDLATLPVWKFRGVQPGRTKKEAVLADPQWGAPKKQEKSSTSDELLSYRVGNADVVLSVRHDVIQTIDLQLSDGVPLAQITASFQLTDRLPDQSLPSAARNGPAVSSLWQACQFACGRVVVFVDSKTREEMVRGLRFYGPDPLPKSFQNAAGMTMKLIPAGDFLMGSHEPAADVVRLFGVERERAAAEHPQHSVRFSRPFYMAACETTVAQFRQFVTATGYRVGAQAAPAEGVKDVRALIAGGTWEQPGFPQDDTHPVVSVSWRDAVSFCEWLSRKDRRKYRLPTEAEWEYACRSGTTGRYNSGEKPESLVSVANVLDQSAYEQLSNVTDYIRVRDGFVFTSPVGHFRANAFGLYDMHGNAWEWCQDWYDENYYATRSSRDPTGPRSGTRHVFRGGCWY